MKFRVMFVFLTVIVIVGSLGVIMNVDADSGLDIHQSGTEAETSISSSPLIIFANPTPNNNSRRINNQETINVSITEANVLDSCLLEWNGVNESMNMSGSWCYKTKETIDGAAYSFKVYANDSSGNSNVSEMRTFTENSKPNLTALAIAPISAITGSNLTCNFTLADSEADNLSVNYSWYNGSNRYGGGNLAIVNNTPAIIALGANIVAHFESRNCSVKPYDGYEYGEEESDGLTISNSAPLMSLYYASCDTQKTITLNAGDRSSISLCAGNISVEIVGINTQTDVPKAGIKLNSSFYFVPAGAAISHDNIRGVVRSITSEVPPLGGRVEMFFQNYDLNLFNNSILSKSINETESITITISGADADNDLIDYSVNDSRLDKTNNNTYELKTSYADSGTFSFLFTADDRFARITKILNLNVNNVPFVGNTSNITSNLADFAVLFGDSSNLSLVVNETENVRLNEGNMTIVNFDFNFSKSTLNFGNIRVLKQPNTSSQGWLLINGIDLQSQNQTKTAYLDNLAAVTGICIKDADIWSINEISADCKSSGETWVACPGSNGQYGCEFNSTINKYKVSGLSHSGIRQQETYCGDGIANGGETCSSCPQDAGSCPSSPSGSPSGGSGGGGGGMVIAAPKPVSNTETENVTNTTKAEPSIHISKTFNLTNNIPQEANESQNETIQKKEQQGLFDVTGNIIGNAFGKNKFGAGLVIFLIISVIVFFIYNKKSKFY